MKKVVCFVLCAVAFYLIGVFSTQFKCVNSCPVLSKLMGGAKCCPTDATCTDGKCCKDKCTSGCKDMCPVGDKIEPVVICKCPYCSCTPSPALGFAGQPCTCTKEKCMKHYCNCNKWKKEEKKEEK
jgi:hypothetical protein